MWGRRRRRGSQKLDRTDKKGKRDKGREKITNEEKDEERGENTYDVHIRSAVDQKDSHLFVLGSEG